MSVALGCGLALAAPAQASGMLWNPTQATMTIIPQVRADYPSLFTLTIWDPNKPSAKAKVIPVDSEDMSEPLPAGHLVEFRAVGGTERIPTATFEVAFDHPDAEKRTSFIVKYAAVTSRVARILETLEVVEAPPAGERPFRLEQVHPSVLILLESKAELPRRRALPNAVSSRLEPEEKKGLGEIAEGESEEESPLPRRAPKSTGCLCWSRD